MTVLDRSFNVIEKRMLEEGLIGFNSSATHTFYNVSLNLLEIHGETYRDYPMESISENTTRFVYTIDLISGRETRIEVKDSTMKWVRNSACCFESSILLYENHTIGASFVTSLNGNYYFGLINENGLAYETQLKLNDITDGQYNRSFTPMGIYYSQWADYFVIEFRIWTMDLLYFKDGKLFVSVEGNVLTNHFSNRADNLIDTDIVVLMDHNNSIVIKSNLEMMIIGQYK
jgi:hypothetical protein